MISPLLTDLYQLTMAYGYWKLGLHEREAVFHQLYRKPPFANGYAVACGLSVVMDFLADWHFSDDDLAYLASLKTTNAYPLFSMEFLEYLHKLRFSCDLDAVLEGYLIFPNEPFVRIKGPLIQGQLLESTILNIINFQTLIATKASRVYLAAQGDSILEFGMRRAQGPDGALSASRAAYIGGCDATSNVLAGKLYGIPVSGTHAHSWVTAFSDEMTAFSAYAEVMPHNCVLLVDTYDTLEGVRRAVEVGKHLKKAGGELRGIRLDSGNLAELSIKAREILDQAGFTETKIIASNSLSEEIITSLKQQGAKISVWGVGTNLATAYEHPALDGVYKLSAIRDENNVWQYKLKLSEQVAKISNPGILQVRRYFANDVQLMDVIYDEQLGIPEQPKNISFAAPHQEYPLSTYTNYLDLLQPVFRKGKLVQNRESIHEIRQRATTEVTRYMANCSPTEYPVGLESQLHLIKQKLINKNYE